MPLEEKQDSIPLRWLKNARSDLAIARLPIPQGGLYEHLCFHAQQAAEKSLKAVLILFAHGDEQRPGASGLRLPTRGSAALRRKNSFVLKRKLRKQTGLAASSTASPVKVVVSG